MKPITKITVYAILTLIFCALPALCRADARLSILRDVRRSDGPSAESVSLVCAKDKPALAECKVVRLSDGAAPHAKPVTSSVAREILSASFQRLSAFETAKEPENARLHWVVALDGKSSRGGIAKGSGSAVVVALMEIESRLVRELDR